MKTMETQSDQKIRVGDHVTKERATYHDGYQVEGWPHAAYVGEVTQLFDLYGVATACVAWSSGRRGYESIGDLVKVVR